MTARHLLPAIAAAALLLTAPAASSQDLRMATSFAVESLDPISDGFWMQEFGVGEMLMQFREDGGFYPWLLSDLRLDGETRWVLTLREGIRFHNGNRLDAEVVHAAIAHQLDHSAGARGSFPDDARFTVTGEYELTFETDAPFPALPALLADETVFLIYDVAAVDAAGSDDGALAAAGIYTGPYRTDTLGADTLTLSRFDQYWQGMPALEEVSVHFISDTNARLLAVQNDEIDVALFMPIAVVPVIEATPGLHFSAETPSANSYSTFLNLREPPFDDPRVRRAFALAIDYDSIAKDIFSGLFQPATSFYASLYRFAVDNLATDTERAAQLLDEAGWLMGPDGVRYRDGQPLRLSILYNPGVSDLVALTTGLQAQLHPHGFLVEPRGVPDTYAAYGEPGWNAGVHNQSSGGNGVPELFLRRHFTPDGDRNYGGYDNPEITELANRLSTTTGEAERHQLLERIQTIMIEEDVGFLILVDSRLGVVSNDRYASYRPGFYFFNLDWQTQPD